MKMISGNICLLLAALGMLCSCEDTRLDGMSPDQVYIVQSGVQNIFVDSRDFADFTVTVYKSGLGVTSGKVGLSVDTQLLEEYNAAHGTSFELLPETCYTLSRTSRNFKASTVSFNCTVTFDGAILARYCTSGEKKYVLPLRVHSENEELGVIEDKSGVLLIPVLEQNQGGSMREGPVNDMALLYYGGSHRPNQWDNDALQSNVSYIDAEGIEHWLFDSFLFLEFNAGNGRYFESGYDNGENTDGIAARKEDWLAMLDKYFAQDGPIARLNTVISQTAARIGSPKYKRRLVVFVPAAFYKQKNWGELNGKALDFSVAQDRIDASLWWVDYAREKFNSLNLKYLSFDGIYYVAEQLTNNRQYLPDLAREIQNRGLKFYWIPYWGADGMGEWKEMGFDEAFLQPNYFFSQQKPDYQSYFDKVMGYAKSHGMSLEMEFDERGLKQSVADYRGDRLWDYIKAFSSYEVAKSNHIAYYQSDTMVHALHCSSDPDDQALYRALCSMIVSRQKARGEK